MISNEFFGFLRMNSTSIFLYMTSDNKDPPNFKSFMQSKKVQIKSLIRFLLEILYRNLSNEGKLPGLVSPSRICPGTKFPILSLYRIQIFKMCRPVPVPEFFGSNFSISSVIR